MVSNETLAQVAAAYKGGSPLAETPYTRSYFYVGGEYVDDGSGGHVFRDQMYVEQLAPISGATQKFPLVIIHGQGQTGTNFLNKPDGGRGWASQFISQGYELYIVDQPSRGRSPWQPGNGASSPSVFSAEYAQRRFTAVENYNLWPQASTHTQWPGSGLMGDPIFDAFYSSNVQFINNSTYQQSAVQAAGAMLLDKIGKPVILMGHSQGGTMPLVIADARPSLAKALILLEPAGPPFRDDVFSNESGTVRPYGVSDIPLTYHPAVEDPSDLAQQVYPSRGTDFFECALQAEYPTPRKLVNLASKPILVVTSEASPHITYDYCTVRYLRQAGCSRTQAVELADIGVRGNGHMFFMEKNSDQIQAVVHAWITAVARGLGLD
ncbi:Alpha/beta hydrolase family-domain-containing protein [Earliella scabrosa]|nr:Alpha/beta hydrolase family-domain-containing protein [Earliella scabrosa]